MKIKSEEVMPGKIKSLRPMVPKKPGLQRLGVLKLSHNYPNRGEHCLEDAILDATDMVQDCDENTKFSQLVYTKYLYEALVFTSRFKMTNQS
jgi:hypothetical protein